MQELRLRAAGTACARAQVTWLRDRLLKLGTGPRRRLGAPHRPPPADRHPGPPRVAAHRPRARRPPRLARTFAPPSRVTGLRETAHGGAVPQAARNGPSAQSFDQRGLHSTAARAGRIGRRRRPRWSGQSATSVTASSTGARSRTTRTSTSRRRAGWRARPMCAGTPRPCERLVETLLSGTSRVSLGTSAPRSLPAFWRPARHRADPPARARHRHGGDARSVATVYAEAAG